MAGKRKLPLVTEQSLAGLKQVRAQLSSDFDRELQRSLRDAKLTISCRSGCANCCHHPVLITAMEGALMYRWIADHGRWTPSFQARVREHAEKTKDLPHGVWFLSVLPCPMLDTATNRCSVYAARPYVCRVTYAVGDPENCHPHRIAQSSILNKQEVMVAFHREQHKLAKKHGLQMVLMPISMALIIGQKIISGEIDLEAADHALLQEFGGFS